MTVVDAIYYGTLFETLTSAKDLSKFPLLSSWFTTVSKNEKIAAGVDFVKELVKKKS